jgi:hypothetical protein
MARLAPTALSSALLLCTLIVAAFAAPTPSLAQDTQQTAAVLSIVSDDGDDDFATALTVALRSAVEQVPAFKLDAREISLPQMMIANGCADADAECLGKIAGTLGVARVFFGSIERAEGSATSVLARIRVYNHEGKLVERTVEDTIALTAAGRDSLAERTVRYVSDLSGVRLEGVLRVRVNVPGALIHLDGRELGVADSSGILESTIEAGDHELRVTSDAHAPYAQKISLIANHGATVEVFLQPSGSAPELSTPGEGSGSLAWLGWSLVGLGVAGAGLTVASSVIISGLDDDKTFAAYRDVVPEGKDACTEADANEKYGTFSNGEIKDVKSTCSQASLFEALWWVGLGVGVAATSVGVFILLTDDDDEGDVASFQLIPSVGAGTASLTAKFRF